MAKRKVSKQSIRQSKQKQEEEQKKTRQNRIITIVAGVLILIVLGVVVWQLFLRPVETEPEISEGVIIDSARPLSELEPSERENFYDEYPEMVINPEAEYDAIIRTEKGDMRLRLFAEEAPLTVNNFVFLAQQGFYDGTVFHRVLQDFMAQGGDPTGTGGGGPGYQFEDETENGLVFDRPGLLAMANAGPATNGSQFFITFVPTPHLNGNHTIFGEILEGQDVLESISFVQPGGLTETGTQGDVIQRIDIVEN